MKKKHINNACMCAFLILLFLSCNDRKKNLLDLFETQQSLKHEIIRLKDGDYLSRTFGLYKDHDNLIIHNNNGQTYISIFDLKKQKIINQFIKYGNGPQEMFSPPQSITVQHNNKLTYLDAQNRIMYEADYSKLDSVKITKSVDLTKTSELFLGLIPMAYNYYVGIGLFEKGRYSVLDKNGKNISINFNYPKDNMQQGSNAQKAMAYQGGLIPNSDKTKFFFYGITSEILEIMQIQKNGSLTKIKDLHFDYAKYILNDDGKATVAAAIKKETKMAFISACATSKYIYLLYSGRSINGDVNLAFKSNTILVFDWKGNPTKRYNLDTDVNIITVSEDDRSVYAIKITTDDTNLIKFKL